MVYMQASGTLIHLHPRSYQPKDVVNGILISVIYGSRIAASSDQASTAVIPYARYRGIAMIKGYRSTATAASHTPRPAASSWHPTASTQRHLTLWWLRCLHLLAGSAILLLGAVPLWAIAQSYTQLAPPVQPWGVNWALPCQTTTNYSFIDTWPGDTPQYGYNKWIQQVNQTCGTSASYTYTYTLNTPCNPTITISSGDNGPNAWASATGCTVTMQATPTPSCTPSYFPAQK